MARRTGSSNARLIDVVSYLGIMLIGIALFFVMLSSVGVKWFDDIVGTCQHIAQIIAYALLGWNSYFYARARGTKSWRWILWVIAVVLIIIFYVIGWGAPTWFK